MTGITIAISVFVLVLTGLPWSGFIGSKIAGMTDTNGDLGQGRLAINPPRSDLNELSWTTRKNKQPVPSEKGSSGHHGNAAMSQTKLDYQVSIDKVIEQAQKSGIKKPFSIVYPSDKIGTFIVSNTSNSGVTGLDVFPYEEQTFHFDQYNSRKLGTIKCDGYGAIAKWFTQDIPPHEGHLFGTVNKIINLFVCIALLVTIGTGFVSWINRTKNTAVKVLHRVRKPTSIPLIICLIVLGLSISLFGLLLILALIIELILYIKDHRVKQ